MPRYLFVDQPDTISSNLTHHDHLGVDTEFMREKTYFAQLCLVQVATDDDIYCVDPLTDGGQQEFWQALLARGWVVHSARQDIEVVFQTTGSMPASIFDTQVAAGLLGYPAQMGYAGLIKDLFDIDMAKSHTRADWTKRPLREAYLQYAAEDVEYLLPAYERLGERLDRESRLDWARQDSRLLLDPQLYGVGADQAVERLKGARSFQGRKRAAAGRLAAWRESEAIRRNRPRQWILRDNVLLEIAYKLPTSEEQLAAIEGLSPKLVNRLGKTLLQAVDASATDENNYRPPSPPGEEQKALLKEMQARVAQCAEDLGLAAETVASKRELAAIIEFGTQQSRVFSGWRRDIIGNALLNLM
ncbi:MAG: ribonuclease D [Gammaproteobacteria bacterium]|nr:ribonuclease D [Gammaproteobacteria bacterium]